MTKDILQMTVPTPFDVGDVHLYLLKGDVLTLVDGGVKTKEAWDVLKEQLKKNHVEPKDIEQIVLTHHHPDHMGLLEQFDPQYGILGEQHNQKWLSREEEYFLRYEEFFKNLYYQSGVPKEFESFLSTLRAPLKYVARGELSGVLKEGDTLPGHEAWKVIETAGHAQTHLSFFREKDGAFLSGDHILPHISSNPLLEPPLKVGVERPRPLLQYRGNLKKCMELSIETVFPGHGEIFTRPQKLIENRLLKQEKRAMRVKEMLKKGPQTAFQICVQLFPMHYEKQFGLTMSETIGQLDFLENEGLISSEYKENHLYYYEKEKERVQ